MNVILSIKPRFIEEIIKGNKTFEYRKKTFKKKVNKVYIYASQPIGRIVGEFMLGEVLYGEPIDIWSRTFTHAGITKEYFDNYFKSHNVAYALEIKNFILYKEPINPFIIFEKFNPPQSYLYIEKDFVY